MKATLSKELLIGKVYSPAEVQAFFLDKAMLCRSPQDMLLLFDHCAWLQQLPTTAQIELSKGADSTLNFFIRQPKPDQRLTRLLALSMLMQRCPPTPLL